MNNSPEVLGLSVPDEIRKLPDSTRLATTLATVLFSQPSQGIQVVLQGGVANVRGWHPEVFNNGFGNIQGSHMYLFSYVDLVLDKTDRPLCHYARMYNAGLATLGNVMLWHQRFQ